MQVVDAVLEEVRVGMEINSAQHNQRRLSTLRYLGELYNYRLVNSKVIFSILYSVITFGADTVLDPPENYFRSVLS